MKGNLFRIIFFDVKHEPNDDKFNFLWKYQSSRNKTINDFHRDMKCGPSSLVDIMMTGGLLISSRFGIDFSRCSNAGALKN